jgi:tRNA threonylcarbamoyladenosine modification (KEOPS) complex  Pcc1 subunit
MMRAKVRIQANEDADVLARALKPEVHDEISRSKMRIEEENGELVISFEAEDVVALRAALNSYLRWAKLAIDTKEIIGVLQ